MQPVTTGLVLLGAYTQPVTTEMVIIIPVPTGYCHRELRPVRTESMKITVDQSGHYRFYSRINRNRSVPKTGIVQILSPLSPFYYTQAHTYGGRPRTLLISLSIHRGLCQQAKRTAPCRTPQRGHLVYVLATALSARSAQRGQLDLSVHTA